MDSQLANIINKNIDLNCYSENAKIANVKPIFKKDKRTKVNNYRPVTLSIFSKIYEKFIYENLTPFVNSFPLKFISAYRKTYSTNHVLIRLIENWKKSLDQNKFVGAVFMDIFMVEILQLRAKFLTAMLSCSRIIWITNSSDHRRV